MAEISIHPLEKLRRDKGLTQVELGQIIYASDGTVRRAELGRSISRKYIDRLIAWSDGQLKAKDFIEAKAKGGRNGAARKKIDTQKKQRAHKSPSQAGREGRDGRNIDERPAPPRKSTAR